MQNLKNSWIIEVSADVDTEDLDPNDCDMSGDCAVDGAYRIQLEGALAETEDQKEVALDIFHLKVPISCLEDYTILIRPEQPLDAGDSWLRLDLGSFSEMPTFDLPPELRGALPDL